ncbi:MAG: hypothetical protein A4E60_00004 [Syntrophorhabdus sp. PtaB.Bin047]|jgi:hypothetical protein|nr:MAG: hypothetical protein A4E60_00004 [Syntrophorhabdus sp. PtaB.Bin047]
MLPSIAYLMLAVLPFVLLSVLAGIGGLPSSKYEKLANDRARSAFHETGQVAGIVTVLGREITVNADKLDFSPGRQGMQEGRQWRKAMIEQAMIDTCVTLQVRCGNDDVDLLWAFMPNESGPVAEIRGGPASEDFDCRGATDLDYARYGRHLFREAIPEGMLSEISGGIVRNYYYSRPATDSGCSFYDMVDLR